MSQIVDFTNCKRLFRVLGGTDKKFEVEYNGRPYIIKFSDKHAKHTDMSTSYINNTISEYICSHISASMGIPTHETVMGMYGDRPVVGCLDFRGQNEENLEFNELVRACYEPGEIKRVVLLEQIYNTLDNTEGLTEDLQKASIERYWDTFVVDALVGNFDRHTGNWGYILRDNMLSLSPVYDFGSSLLPQLSDDGINEIINNDFKMYERCLIFPSAALFITSNKSGKVGYYDMMSSNFDPECTSAVKRMAPRINMEAIEKIIDETPLITDIRKDFYKKYINLRKQLIVDRAYSCCVTKEFDKAALARITDGEQYSVSDLKYDMENNKDYFTPLEIPRYLQEFPDFDDIENARKLKDWQDTSKASEWMPSFEKTDMDGSIYKLYLNYRFSNERKSELSGNKRYELFKDGNSVAKGNSLRSVTEVYEKSVKLSAPSKNI